MRTPQHQVHRIVQVYFTSSSNISIKFYILLILTYQRFGTLGHAELPCIFFSKVRYTGLRRATWYNMSSSSFNNVSIHHLRIKLCLVLHNLLEKSVPTYLPTASIEGLTQVSYDQVQYQHLLINKAETSTYLPNSSRSSKSLTANQAPSSKLAFKYHQTNIFFWSTSTSELPVSTMPLLR